MSYDKYIGMKFTETGKFPPNSGITGVDDDLEEWEEQSYCVESVNGEWEFSLSKDNIIETIFIFPNNGGKLIHGIKGSWSRKEVLNKLGTPESSGEKIDDEILGKKGAWDRFNMKKYYLHIEYNYAGSAIEQQTIMLPHVVP